MRASKLVLGAGGLIASAVIAATAVVGFTGTAQAADPPPGPTRCVPGQQQPGQPSNCVPRRHVDGNRRGGHGGGMRPGAGFTDVIGTVAGSLGMTKDQVLQELRSGKSLQDVAGAKGKPPAELTSIISTQMKADIQKAVGSGKLSQKAADAISKNLDRFIGRMITVKGGQFGQRSGPGGPGGQGGPGSQSTNPGGPPRQPGTPPSRPQNPGGAY